jgi:hypothetical protein
MWLDMHQTSVISIKTEHRATDARDRRRVGKLIDAVKGDSPMRDHGILLSFHLHEDMAEVPSKRLWASRPTIRT